MELLWQGCEAARASEIAALLRALIRLNRPRDNFKRQSQPSTMIDFSYRGPADPHIPRTHPNLICFWLFRGRFDRGVCSQARSQYHRHIIMTNNLQDLEVPSFVWRVCGHVGV
eukprot:2707533-Amphidinium_carterae.1